MKTLLLDCEFGSRPVKKLIDAGRVERIPIPDFTAYMNVVRALVRGQTKLPDVLALDTITSLSAWARHEIVAGAEMHDVSSLWEQKKRLNASLPEWGQMADYIGRSIFELRALEKFTIVILAHSGLRMDEVEQKKREGPDLPNQLLGYVTHLSDVIMRITVAGKNGSQDGVPIVAGKTRRGDIAINPDTMGKAGRTDPDRIVPEYIINPTLPKIDVVLGERPHIITVFGREGAGKTTIGCSYSQEEAH